MKGWARSANSHTFARQRDERSFIPRGTECFAFWQWGVESSKGHNKEHKVVASGLRFYASWGQRSAQECQENQKLWAGSELWSPFPVWMNMSEWVRTELGVILASGDQTLPTAAAGLGWRCNWDLIFNNYTQWKVYYGNWWITLYLICQKKNYSV